MDLVLATIPKSTPTKTLEGVHNAMAEACKVVNVLQPGMSQIQAVLQQIEDYLAKAVGGLDIVDKILGAIKIALQVCKYLGKLIPYVGEALSQIAGYIEGMKIEDTIRKVLQRIKDLVEKVRSGVMKNIRTAIVTISSKVNKIAEELPRYVDTANIMAALFSLVDISIYGIFGTTTDGEIKKLIDTTLQGLEKLANGAKQGIDTLKTAFEPFTRFLEEIWKDVKENILGPINKGFGTIIDSLQPIFHWIKDVVSSCDTIKEWFQPFFWVLDKLEWIVKRTIGWLIDKAKSVFNLDRIFDWFKEKINELLEASGINAIYGEVEGMLQRGLQPCYDRLAELLAPIGDRLGIEQAYREFTKHLSAFQEDPAGHTAELLQKGEISEDSADEN
ncbi:hypothetical protein QFC19_006742 [Naganishia cerealis]|uniref:Uncharacterized protein n=1 Tax=Naganishia cerealis TaxID=610337 RepID=A0ACC2VEJ3_9TREE|nr:hypothetical protein QFC19_006742 [Naganishia cerealis]